MPTVRARQTCIISPLGQTPFTIREGDTYDSDDPIVEEFKWVFADTVEQATAAPGEKRNTRRRSD